MRHPIFVQSLELMEMYVERIRAVLADPERILDAMDSPRPILGLTGRATG